MCGICGICGFSELGPEAEDLTRAMCRAMVHRGPDDEGYYFDDRVALGMRRLSIIDLVTGHQPLSNEDGTIWTIYNGEIYNFPELKKRLVDKGHNFRTQTDTEVIVHLYEEKGESFVQDLNGMFAVALWDRAKKKLILVRDRLGVKPLHYLRYKGQLLFSSEIKSLLQSACPREIDLEALSQYFTFEYIPAPRTIFRGIQKLLPGEMLVLENGRVTLRPYWDVRFEPKPSPSKSEEEYAEEIEHRLKESVRMRLISDVPLGVFLSGGIDSSSITSLMSEGASSPIKTFSIGFKEKSFDELDYAKTIAERFGTEHREFVVESSLVKDLVPLLMNYVDEPLADASIIPTYIISKLARQYVTVALAGDGGDELFAGYDTYKAYKVARLYRRVPRFIRTGIVKNLVSLLPATKKRLSFEFKAKKFIAGVEYPPEIANFVWWGAFTPAAKKNLFSEEFREALGQDAFAPVSFHLRNCRAGETLDKLAYLDLKLYLQDDLLVKVDRMSMANSLEIRVPFLDYTFVEFAATIPSSLKLKGMTSKYILKKAMSRRLPREIIRRKKIGFDIPLGVWIKDELKDFVASVLSPENLNKHHFFNAAHVGKIMKEHFDGNHNHRQLLWPLIIFQFWYDRYLR